MNRQQIGVFVWGGKERMGEGDEREREEAKDRKKKMDKYN